MMNVNHTNVLLKDVMDLVVDNDSCIVFKVKRGTDEQMVKILATGVLNGDECFIRIQKAPKRANEIRTRVDVLAYGYRTKYYETYDHPYMKAIIRCAKDEFGLSVIRQD